MIAIKKQNSGLKFFISHNFLKWKNVYKNNISQSMKPNDDGIDLA